MISLLQVQAICNSKRPAIAAVYEFLPAALDEAQVDTPLRMAMFLAQAAHETSGFQYLTEIADGSAYEGRADLGNTEPGDGPRFRGRGIFQTTGRGNYSRTSRSLFGSELVLLETPELLAQPEWAVKSATYYWTWKDLNRFADAGDFQGLTRKINGGLNHYDKRVALLARAKQALGF